MHAHPIAHFPKSLEKGRRAVKQRALNGDIGECPTNGRPVRSACESEQCIVTHTHERTLQKANHRDVVGRVANRTQRKDTVEHGAIVPETFRPQQVCRHSSVIERLYIALYIAPAGEQNRDITVWRAVGCHLCDAPCDRRSLEIPHVGGAPRLFSISTRRYEQELHRPITLCLLRPRRQRLVVHLEFTPLPRTGTAQHAPDRMVHHAEDRRLTAKIVTEWKHHASPIPKPRGYRVPERHIGAAEAVNALFWIAHEDDTCRGWIVV